MTRDPAAKEGRDGTPMTDKLIDDMLHGAGIPRCVEWDQLVRHAESLESNFYCANREIDSVETDRDHLRERVKELEAFAASVRDWYENAGNADPDRESPGSRELWSAARAALSKSPK